MKLRSMMARLVMCASAAVLLYGCVSSPNYPAPPLAGSIEVIKSPLPLDKEITYTTAINGGPVYLFQSGGSSITAGLLGGYFLNNYLISKKTDGILSGTPEVAPVGIADRLERSIDKKEPRLLGSDHDPLFSLQSAILVKADHNAVVRATLMTRASTSSERYKWSKSYFYLFDKTITRSQLEAGGGGLKELAKGVAEELDKAINQTSSVIVDDLSGKLSSGTQVRLKSRDLNPMPNVNFVFDGLRVGRIDDRDIVRIDGKPGMIVFPTVDGVHIINPSQYSIDK